MEKKKKRPGTLPEMQLSGMQGSTGPEALRLCWPRGDQLMNLETWVGRSTSWSWCLDPPGQHPTVWTDKQFVSKRL